MNRLLMGVVRRAVHWLAAFASVISPGWFSVEITPQSASLVLCPAAMPFSSPSSLGSREAFRT